MNEIAQKATAEKAFLQTKIDAIDVLLNHYIS